MQVLLIIKGQGKLCGAYMVTLIHQAPISEWYNLWQACYYE